MHTGHIIIALCILLAAIAIAAMIALLRRTDPLKKLLCDNDKDWFTPIAIVVGLISIVGYMQERDQRITQQLAAQERARATETARLKDGWLPSKCREIVISLDDCGPRGPGLTNQVVFAIATQPDCKHVNHGCTRIAQRGYLGGTP